MKFILNGSYCSKNDLKIIIIIVIYYNNEKIKSIQKNFNQSIVEATQMCMSGREMYTTAKLSTSILSQLSSIKITSRNKIKQGWKHRQIKMSTEVMFLRSHCYHVPERTSPLLSPCTYSVYANIRSDHPVRLMRRRLAAPKLLMLPQVQRPNRKPSPLTTITAAAAGVPLPPLDLTEENVKQVLVDARAEASIVIFLGWDFLCFSLVCMSLASLK